MNYSAAVLLSQQPLQPTATTEWVINTKKALQWVKKNNLVLFSSVGMPSWDIITVIARKEKIPLKIVIPAKNEDDFNNQCQLTVYQFDLHEHSYEFIPVLSESKQVTKRKLLRQRDYYIMQQAAILIPVSVKTNGQIAGLLAAFREQGKTINKDYFSSYQKRTHPLQYNISVKSINRQVMSLNHDYVIHWTRTVNQPWIHERSIDFYTALLSSEEYPRSALFTLRNIISLRKIIASSRHMPESIPTVSFSGLAPKGIIPLVRWRARYVHMSFEPYGIGIEKEYALHCGIKPVVYYQKNNSQDLIPSDCQSWLRQSKGRKSDWQRENEYRYPGDFCLATIPEEKLICFCRFPHEVEILQTNHRLKIVSFLFPDEG